MKARATTTMVLLLAVLTGCDSAAKRDSRKPGTGESRKSASAAEVKAATPVAVAGPAAQNAAMPQAAQPAGASASGPRWAIESPRHNFGEVWAGVTVRHPFEFKNVGDQTLRILEAKPHCSCSVADNYTREVPPGGKGQIPFVLKTVNKPHGPIEEYLTLKTNDPTQPEMKIFLEGKVKTVCQTVVVQDWQATTPEELAKIKNAQGSFTRVATNDRPYRVLRMTNTTGAPINMTMMPVGRARLDTDEGTKVVETPFDFSFNEITPNQEWELVVTGKPPFPVGRVTSNINFSTGISDQPTYMVYASAYNPPRIEIIPQRIVHMAGAKPINNARTIIITNNGSTPFKVTAVSASTPDYAVSVLPKDPAKPAQTLIEVKFPHENYLPPPYGEVVRIETDDPEFKVFERMVLPSMNPATPRPADKPIQWHAGKVGG